MTNNRRGVIDEMKFDTRITGKLLQDGDLDPKEHEKFLKSLPDESAKVAYIDVFREKPAANEEQANPLEGLTFTSA